MKGLDLARNYYLSCGRHMLETRFPKYVDSIACGLAGEGSECLGFDDEISQDHDFGAGFCMWLTDKDFAEIGEKLREAYAELPGFFGSWPKRNPVSFGEWRLSAVKTSDFYRKFTGLSRAPETLEEWRRIPEHFLAAAVSGEVFTDPPGAFSAVRKKLIDFYPEDLRLKKIAARIAVASQAGQYQFFRCIGHGEKAAALLALAEFIRAVCSAAYLLNKKYMPYYKWARRGLKDLPVLDSLHDLVESLAKTKKVSAQQSLVEEICALLLSALQSQGFVSGTGDFLLDHCGEIMSHIKDSGLRAMHIMAE
ncbi:MAG: DUF4037 domain-containing protein [Treponema sp.]|jgi:hypothetical protein|nr:DUF4037 domain-containing protein [Treponema sp.]